MLASLVKKFCRDKKAATAVAMAIMTVPLLIGASAAVDFSRVASARTLLQASVDAAAIAGAGEWQMSESSSAAYTVTQNMYATTGAQLPSFVSTTAPAILLACTGTTGAGAQTTNQCGGTHAFSTTAITGCPTNGSGAATFEYCVVVSETATLKNSLFAWLIPSETLTVRSVGTANFPPYVVSGKNIPPSPGFGSAGDLSGIYAYAVPNDGPGGTPNYGESVSPNSDCNNANGPLKYEYLTTPPAGVTSCNFLYVAVSTSQGNGGTGGSISLQQNQAIAFTFVNDTGETNTYGLDDRYKYTTGLTVGNQSRPNGDSVCSGNYGEGGCATVPLFGECPDRTLFGSFSQKVNTSNKNVYEQDTNGRSVTISRQQFANGAQNSQDSTGASDSLNVYSSAFEVLGFPPTHATNHALPTFTSTIKETVNGQRYKVAIQCPRWPTTTTTAGASPGGPQDTNINKYATYYPDVTYTDSSGSDIFPPEIASCTPVESPTATNATPDATSNNQWWGWSPSNSYQCQSQTIGFSQYYPYAPQINSTTALQTASNNNCALIIQPLGTNVPVDSNNYALLPDYYIAVEDVYANLLALDPVYDNQSYTEVIPGVTMTTTGIYVEAGTGPTSTGGNGFAVGTTGVVDTNPAETYNAQGQANNDGYTPSTTSVVPITSGKYAGQYAVTEKPAISGIGTDHNLPQQTSRKCYNPSAATQLAGYYPNGPNNAEAPGYRADGTPIDAISNPQDGAIFCNSTTPETYGLYWNDMGSNQTDDLGYWNAVEAFTCSVPSQTNYGGGAATLSG